MDRIVEQVTFPTPKKMATKKVAAYCRVSSGKDAMQHSLSAQISYYSTRIQSTSGWVYAGVYSDEALSGTKRDRPGFQRLLSDCRAGKIDLILTKSVTRFSRNTVVFLETVRELKALGIGILFEEQNINTLTGEGELMLTILSSFAQEESYSVSENMKWRIKKNFEDGQPWNGTLLGYRIVDGQYTIVPEEAEIIKRIYKEYLQGKGAPAIAKGLNEDKVLTRRGCSWNGSTVAKILRNISYTGNLVLQKTFVENNLTKVSKPNNGEKPKYEVEEAHEAIIPTEQFEAVQREIACRLERFEHKSKGRKTYPLSGKIFCEHCGKNYSRKTTATQVVWICSTYNLRGKEYCQSKQIPESTLMELIAGFTDDISDISKIVAKDENVIDLFLADGSLISKKWEDRSRSKSWTPESRQAARERILERNRQK